MNDTSNTGVNSTGTVENSASTMPEPPVQISVPPVTPVSNIDNESSIPATPEIVSVATTPEPPVTPAPAASPLNLEDKISSASVVDNPTSTPSVPDSPLVDKVESPVTPAAPASPLADTPTPESAPTGGTELNITHVEEPKEEKKKEKKKETKNGDNVPEGEINKAPIVIVVIFILLLVLLLVYYFVIMTPRHVFETAIDDTVSALGNAIQSVEDSNTKEVNLKFDFDMTTFNDNLGLERLQGVKRLDGEQFKSNISVDLEKGNFLITLSAERAKDYTDNYKFGMCGDKNNYEACLQANNGNDKNKKLSANKDYSNKDTSNMILDTSFYSYDGNMYMYPKYYYNDNKYQQVEAFPPFNIQPFWRYVNGEVNDYDARAKKIQEVQAELDAKKITQHEANMKIDEIETYYGDGNKVLKNIDNDKSLSEKEAKERKDAVNKQIKDGNVASEGKIVQADVLGIYGLDNLSTDLNTKKVHDIYTFAERVKTRIQKELRDDQLHRTIALKKINQDGKDTTAVALKVHCQLDNEEISHIYKTIFKEWLDSWDKNGDNWAIKDLSEILGIPQKDVAEEIRKLYNRTVVTDDIDVNLYMNLANTELISLDVTVDNKYHAELSLLNGYYSMRFYVNDKDREDQEDKLFDIKATYDNDKGIVDGVGYIHNEHTYLIVDFYYKRIEDEEGKKDGNTLYLTFYDGKSHYKDGPVFDIDGDDINVTIEDEPFAQLKCSLDLQQNEMLDELKEFEDYALNSKEGKINAWAVPVVIEGSSGVGIPIDTVNMVLGPGVKLLVNDIAKTVVDKDKLQGELDLVQSSDLLKFQMGFLGHVDYLVDHLLRLTWKDYVPDAGSMPLSIHNGDDNKKSEETSKPVEEVKPVEEPKVEEKVEEKTEEQNNTTTENNTSETTQNNTQTSSTENSSSDSNTTNNENTNTNTNSESNSTNNGSESNTGDNNSENTNTEGNN